MKAKLQGILSLHHRLMRHITHRWWRFCEVCRYVKTVGVVPVRERLRH